MKCKFCGEGDIFDKLQSHMYYCDSKEGFAYMKAKDSCRDHTMYCQCEDCV